MSFSLDDASKAVETITRNLALLLVAAEDDQEEVIQDQKAQA